MTGKLIPFRVGDVEVLIETSPAAGSEQTSRLADVGGQTVAAFEHVRETVQRIAESTAELAGRLRRQVDGAEELELEFGLKVSAQGRVVVAGAAAEASIAVRLTWRRGDVAATGGPEAAAAEPAAESTVAVIES